MKILIAGLGSIGRRHFRNWIALGEKDIVLLRTRKATLPDDELAGYPVETDLQAALAKHQLDAVVVANSYPFGCGYFSSGSGINPFSRKLQAKCWSYGNTSQTANGDQN